MHAILPANHAAAKTFLTGPFGSGKTSAAIDHIRGLLARERTRGDEVLVLVPQVAQGQVYRAALRQVGAPPGPPVKISTVAGLARDSVELYWPLLAPGAGFADPHQEPTFLNLETAQYHMRALVEAAIGEAEFDGIRVHPNRIISQVLDNLSKAALHSFTIDEAYARLELAIPPGDQRTGQLNALRAARRISHAFRALCLERALVDFSLQTELFDRHILTNDWSRTHLFRSRRHLIIDNVEEQNAVTHDLIRRWLPHLESALIIHDEDAGYRLFLGADPQGAPTLADDCDATLRTVLPDDVLPGLRSAAARVNRALLRGPQPAPEDEQPAASVLHVPDTSPRFYPQMLTWVAHQVKTLVERDGIAPGEIAIVAPFVSNGLRFSLQTALDRHEIRSTTHRPSRALQDEPSARCLLTLARLAHPEWQTSLHQADVALALQLAITRLDPIRAGLLTRIVYPLHRRTVELTRFANLQQAIQRRITYAAGEAYDLLRDWLYAYRGSGEPLPLDQFLARLFSEVLSRPGFGFHADYGAARVAHQLIASARSFRWSLQENDQSLLDPSISQRVGEDYLRLVASGAFGALYTPGVQEPEDAVFIAPAYTFLMRNRSVDVQFWLDIGSSGWWERLYQPLTHPHVLTRHWPAAQPWTDLDEFQTRQEIMRRVLLGLIRRTRHSIYLGVSEYAENGSEQRGPLLSLLNRILRQNA
jgi:hypothetical protein